jgi:hypothetical protein
MEHPLITNIDHLTEQQLTDKISELNKKMAIASRMGNGHLCNQIRLALDTYRNKYRDKIRKDNDTPFDEVIDIS